MAEFSAYEREALLNVQTYTDRLMSRVKALEFKLERLETRLWQLEGEVRRR